MHVSSHFTIFGSWILSEHGIGIWIGYAHDLKLQICWYQIQYVSNSRDLWHLQSSTSSLALSDSHHLLKMHCLAYKMQGSWCQLKAVRTCMLNSSTSCLSNSEFVLALSRIHGTAHQKHNMFYLFLPYVSKFPEGKAVKTMDSWYLTTLL